MTFRLGPSGASSAKANRHSGACGCERGRCMVERPASRFVAEYRFDDRAWIVQFRDPDIATFGGSLASAKRYARSARAVWLEVDDLATAGVEVVDDVRLPPKVADEVHRLADR